MKRGCAALLLIFSSAAGFARAGQAKADKVPSEFEQTMMTAEKGFVDAAKKGDVAFFKRTLTDDFSYVSYDGQLYNRQEMLDQYGQAGTDILPYEMKVVSAGEGVAIVTYNVVLPSARRGGSRTAAAVSALHDGVGEAGRRLENEIPANDGGALGRLVGIFD